MFFILDNNIKPGLVSVTNLSVSLDGQAAVPFEFIPNGTDDYEYNASVYQSCSMPLQEQSVLLSSGDETPSLLLFDYAVYT